MLSVCEVFGSKPSGIICVHNTVLPPHKRQKVVHIEHVKQKYLAKIKKWESAKEATIEKIDAKIDALQQRREEAESKCNEKIQSIKSDMFAALGTKVCRVCLTELDEEDMELEQAQCRDVCSLCRVECGECKMIVCRHCKSCLTKAACGMRLCYDCGDEFGGRHAEYCRCEVEASRKRMRYKRKYDDDDDDDDDIAHCTLEIR